jgi:predicted NBD/HSP70 family sugar kinase
MRRMNERAIVRHVQQVRSSTRAECAKALGLSQPTVGKIVDELLADHILEEVQLADGQRVAGQENEASRLGRPGRILRMDQRHPTLGLVQLGVTHTRVAAVPVGVLAEEAWDAAFRTAQSPQRWQKDLESVVRKLRDRVELRGVLVSAPGVVDESAGRVLLSPNLHWADTADLSGICETVWGAPTMLVQEIRALALGQLAADPERDSFLLVDFGSGVGAAAVVRARLQSGPIMPGGELGHTPVQGNRRPCGCGAVGCVETLVSRNGLVASLREHQRNESADWPALTDAVRTGRLPAWLTRSLDAAATVIAGTLNVLGLTRVVVTGSLTELPPTVMKYLSDAIVRSTLWARFGDVVCEAAPRRRMRGLAAAAIDRLLLPSDDRRAGEVTRRAVTSRSPFAATCTTLSGE